jgi:hypothetical protein
MPTARAGVSAPLVAPEPSLDADVATRGASLDAEVVVLEAPFAAVVVVLGRSPRRAPPFDRRRRNVSRSRRSF